MSFISQYCNNVIDAYKTFPAECKEVYKAFKSEGLKAFRSQVQLINAVAIKALGAFVFTVGGVIAVSAVVSGGSFGAVALGVTAGLIYMTLGCDNAVQGKNFREHKHDKLENTIIFKSLRDYVLRPIVDLVV